MRIGFDAKRAFFNTRGLGNYSRTLIDGLLAYFPNADYYLFGNEPNAGATYEWYKKVNGKANNVSSSSKSGIGKALWRSYFVENQINELKLDVYHGLSHEIPRKKKNNHTKYIVTIHDLLVLQHKHTFKWIDRQIYLSKIKHSCRCADLIIATSEQTKSDLVNLLNVPESKIVVHYQSCSPVFYPENNSLCTDDIRRIYKLPENYYLFVGALALNKNIERIIKAIAILPSEIQYLLVIVGKENLYKKKLIRLAESLDVVDKVKFVSYVDEKHMPLLYQNARVFIWPSLFEGFGIPIIEALFSKVPVITSNNGCFSEVGGKATCYVNPTKPEEIAGAIVEVISSPEKCEKMKQAGYAFVQKFHIKETTLRLMKIYSEVLKS